MVGMARRTDWAKRVAAWKRSGLTAVEFGERTGTLPKKLYWWSWFLKRREGTTGGRTVVAQKSRADGFLPVVLRPKATRVAPEVRDIAAARVEVGFGNGCVLRTEPVNARWVAELIAVVDGARGC